jgi:hypothetical protein
MKHLLACDCLPKTAFGISLDSLFAYYTPKIVAIQDRSLGLMRIGAMVCIFLYIFVYNIWYQGHHFELSEVEGITRQEWQEPTRMWCNPRHLDCKANYSKIVDLPYCRQYEGASPLRVQRPCKYFDARELPLTLSSGTLIPTYIQKFEQAKDCQDGDQLCERKYHFVDEYGLAQKGDGLAEPLKRDFVADVEDFTLTLDHSFRTTDGKVAYDDFLMQGYWSICDKDLNRGDPDYHKEAALVPRKRHCDTQKIRCVHWKCSEFRGSQTTSPIKVDKAHQKLKEKMPSRSSLIDDAHAHFRKKGASRSSSVPLSPHEFLEVEEEEEEADRDEQPVGRVSPEMAATRALSGDNQSVIAMKGGDVLTLKMLLAMAGESLDEYWDDEDEGALSLRLRGTALMVNIHYDNVEPWTLIYPRDPPWYTISVTSRPAHKFMHSYVSDEDEKSREMTWAYGTYVIVKQTGHIRSFNAVTALMTLTSAMVLLGLSDFLVSMLASYVMPKKAKYRNLMYEKSEEMGEYDSDEDSQLAGNQKKQKSQAEKPAEVTMS